MFHQSPEQIDRAREAEGAIAPVDFERIRQILERESNDLPQGTISSLISKAARTEYVEMMCGRHVYTRGSDIREYRLFLLIVIVFSGSIPSESTVASLFQITQAQSRSLIRSVLSKFGPDLEASVDQTVWRLIDKAMNDGSFKAKSRWDAWIERMAGSLDWDMTAPSEDSLCLVVNNKALIERMNQSIATFNGGLAPVQLERNTLNRYVAPADSLVVLVREFSPVLRSKQA